LPAQHCAVTKLMIIALALAALANSVPDRSDPPLLIDSQPSPTTSIAPSN
jgi:hypothetical protein